MTNKKSIDIPKYNELLTPTINAIKSLGGSGNNDEILEKVITDLKISDKAAEALHKGSKSITELWYQLAWAKTYLRLYGIIENSKRSVWSIKPSYMGEEKIDDKQIIATIAKRSYDQRKKKAKSDSTEALPRNYKDNNPENDEIELPDELKPWRFKLMNILNNMDPFAFERLAQRVLRESGFTQVEVTKKTSDGGIDGTGKLLINGIITFNVVFQCKRYKGLVGANKIRDFRGSLTADAEKGIFITTGTYTKYAKEEASIPGKVHIDLIDGEELINKIAEYGIGVKQIISYEIDEDYFRKI